MQTTSRDISYTRVTPTNVLQASREQSQVGFSLVSLPKSQQAGFLLYFISFVKWPP